MLNECEDDDAVLKCSRCQYGYSVLGKDRVASFARKRL